MKRYSILAATAVVGVGVAFQGSVTLQATTPGTAQNGHLNITGTARAGSVVGNSTTPTGTVFGGDFRTASTSGRGVLGNASATSGVTHGGLFQSASTSGRGVTGISSATTGSAVGGFFTSNSVNGKGVQGSSNALSGLNYGVYGRNVSPQGFALYGEGNVAMTGNLGVGTGTNPPFNRLEVDGTARVISNSSSNGLAVFNNGSGGGIFARGTVAGSFTSITADGIGVTGQAFGGGPSIGVFGKSQSPLGFALLGEGNAGVTGNLGIGLNSPSAHRLEISDNNGNTLGSARIENGGVDFPLTSARAGLAVHVGGPGVTRGIGAIAQSSDGNTTTGIFGQAIGSGTNFGVHGTAIIAAGSFAGFFDGDLFALSASSGVKAFVIDHPLDPENMVLCHSSIESDERMNIYRGVLTTDAQGFATATVPTWFDALNEDIQYQLTVIGDESEEFVLVKVAKKLMNGKFKVRTSKGGVEVNWTITGRRHDPTAKLYPLEVERMKSKNEKGKYYAPEAYGKDKTLGISYPSPKKVAVAAKK